MRNFDCNNIEDLVFSRSFRDWVLDRNSSEAAFWDQWLSRNPDKSDLVDQAKAMVFALPPNPEAISESDIEAEVVKTLRRLKEAPRPLSDDALHPTPGKFSLHPGHSHRMLAVAALLSATGLTAWLIYQLAFPHKSPGTFRYHKDTTISMPDSSHMRAGSGTQTGSGVEAAPGAQTGSGGSSVR